MSGDIGSDLMIMRHTGNGSEVVIFHRTADGDETDYATFPTEDAALGSSGYRWREADPALKAEDPSVVKVAPWEQIAAKPIGHATHEQRHARS